MKNWGTCGQSATVALAVVILVAALPQAAEAQTTHSVCPPGNPSAPCAYPSPGAALNDTGAVLSGDTLEIANDVYALTAPLVVDRSLTLNFNGALVDAAGGRGAEVGGTSTVASINDVTILNGAAPVEETGGAIRVSGGANLTLIGSTLQDNFAENGGGGLSNANSIVTVLNSVFSGNTTDGDGGAVVTIGATAQTVLSQVTIDGNVATVRGGGVAAISGGRIDIVDSAISRNGALSPLLVIDNYGNPTGFPRSCFNNTTGADFIGQTFIATVEGLSGFQIRIFTSGSAPPGPGVIPSDVVVQGRVRSGGPAGPIVATASALIPAGTSYQIEFPLQFFLDQPLGMVIGNTYALEMTFNGPTSVFDSADAYAGGSNYQCSENLPGTDLEFQTFGGNPGQGGGVFSAGEINLANVTVSDNVGDGGYASAGNNVISAVLSTIAGNSGDGLTAEAGGAGQGGVVAIAGSILAGNGGNDCNREDLAALAISQDYNLIGDIAGCEGSLLILQPNDQAGNAGAVIDPLLGPLQDNGGPTFTRALDPSSPAVDSGANDPTCGFGVTPYPDQRGVTRPQGAACDAGAFELEPSAPPLQDLIDAAAPGATIVVPDGTYTGGIIIGDGKTLQGSGPDNVIIDATGLNTSAVTITTGATLIGVRVTGGNAGGGGGILVQPGGFDVVLTDVRVDGNNASITGGGIWVRSGSGKTVTMTRVLVENNGAGTEGGGIYLDGANYILNDIQVIGNSSGGDGGGIYNSAGTVFLGTGTCSATPIIGAQTNVIANNTASTGRGGGIFNRIGTFTITNTRITGNDALEGGGIALQNSSIGGSSDLGSVDIDCSVLDANTATQPTGTGGAITVFDGALALDRSVIAFNGAGAGGGGLNLARNATITNSLFTNNFASNGDGGAIRMLADTELFSTANTYASNVSNGKGGAIFHAGGGFVGFPGVVPDRAFGVVSTDDVYSSNSARSGGGAITVVPTNSLGLLVMFRGLLSGNQTGQGSLSVSGAGGAVEFLGSIGFIQGTQFLNNSAPESGDGNSQGGTIFNSGTGELFIEDSTISGSDAGDGGAIFNAGILSVDRSTLTNNSVTDFNVEPRGGAIASTGTLNVSNSTISGNTVNPGPGNSGDGGAIASFAGGIANLNNVTLAFNSAPDGGALYAEIGQGPLIFRNSLFFSNIGPTGDCDQVLSQGFNSFDVNPCPTQAATDIVGDPLIGLLTNNGGPTETHALLPGSPAQDAGGPVPLGFTDFTSLARFSVQGDAARDGNTLLLAGNQQTAFTVGSAYITDPIDVSSNFSARFDFQILPGSGGGASDGITFTIGDDPTFLGDNGGALGIGSFDDDGLPPYVPTGPTVSGVSVEFDTWDNGAAVGANDPGQEHVGINLDGSLSSAALTSLGPAGTLSDGTIWTAWIDYDAASDLLEVRASNTGSRPPLATVSLTVDILAETDADADGNVYVGFTGAAAGGSSIGGNHRIRNFQFANEASCELVDQRGVTRPEGLRCDIGAFEGSAIPGTIDNASLSVTTNVSQPGVVDVPLIDIPIEKLTGVVGDDANPPESAPLSSFPLSSFPLSSLDLRASPLSSFPLSSFPLSSFDISGAPLSSFPLSSFPLLSVPGGWAAVIEEIPSLAGAPLQNVTLEQVLEAVDRPARLLDNITLGSLAIQGSPLSSLSLAGLALGDNITVETLNQWLANAGSSSTICGELAADGFSDCQSDDTVVGLQVKSAPLSSLPLSSLPLSSFPLSSFPLSSFPLSSLPLSSFPLSSFPLSSFPLSSLPLSSFPLSSLPLSSFPLSSLDLLFAPLSSLPLSSFPLSSLPLSSFDVGGQPFCQYYDALALADGQPSCSLLGIDPSSAGLLELIGALKANGSATLAATPLSSFPLSSFDISSVPLSSFQLDFADIAGLPLSSFPLSSLPLSSLDVGAQDFCDFYDAAANAAGQSTCAVLGISNSASFGDLITRLKLAGESTFASTPLSSFPLSSLPLSSLPLSSFEVNGTPLSSLEINGAPLSSFPLSSFDILGSPLSSLPLSSLPLSSLLVGGSACDGCTTLGDSFAAGQVITDAPLSSLTGSSEFGDIGLGDLLNAFTLEYLFGVGRTESSQPPAPETLGEIADPGNLTLGQLLVSLILRSDFPWENISLSDLDPQAFAADHVVGYSLDFELNGTLVEPVTVNVTLSDQFYLVPGTARFMTQSQGGGTILMSPVPEPVMTANPDDTVTMSFGPVSPGAFSDNTLQFVTVPPLSLGNFLSTASLDLGAVPAAIADASAAAVEVVPSVNNESDNIDFPASTVTNTLILGHIDTTEDIDYFQVTAPPKGSRVAVFMTNPVGDNDLLLYEPLSTVEAKGQTTQAAALPSNVFEDDGVDYEGNRREEPDALEDINLGVLPLSSLSTNRDNADEQVSAISDGEEFTVQVSGYNGSVSEQPYTLRVKVTPEVPVVQCSARTWTTGVTGPQSWTPAGSWQTNTNAVFLVNWQRLADSEQSLTGDGAAAADEALNAVNALVNAPGIVNGVVVDVSDIPGVNYGPWDFDPCDVAAANSVVNAITAYLEEQRAISPNLAYVTIVGSDEVIPFKRKGDETDIANESTFATTFADNALFGSMATRNFLSDDTYGDIDPIKWSSGRWLNLPELAVGRLVESAADIQTAAENYVTAGGLLTPITALSAGYDFVADAATDIQQTLTRYGLESIALIDQPLAVEPNPAEPFWNRDRFLQEAGLTTNNARDVVSFNMHFDYNDALPSSGDALRQDGSRSYQDNLINVGDLAGNDLTGRIWFTVGCHSGINAADIAMLNGEPQQDWAQTFNSLGAVYVGQAAYGLGDTVALALTERLLANFARNLNGNISAGQAHAYAKQDYFKDLGIYGEYDYKALQASVYFGLPMYRIQNPLVVDDPLPPLRPTRPDPISGVASASISLASPGDYNIVAEQTEKGKLYSADGLTVDGSVQFVHYRPLQPIIGIDVTSENPDEVARSAFITGLTTRDELVDDMAFARPVIDEGALEPEIETDEVVFPTRFTTVSSYRVPGDPGPFEDRQQLNIITGQYTSNAGQDFGTQRIFTSVDVQVFYQPTSGTALPQASVAKANGLSDARSALTATNASSAQVGSVVDDTRPELDNINASVVQAGNGFQAAFTVDASDTLGVVTRVAVLYRQSFDGEISTWVLEDLVNSGGTSWTGGAGVDSSGLINGEVDYLVQALDDSGNVANSTFKGTFYAARQTPLPPPPSGGSNGSFGIELTDMTGEAVNPGEWSRVDPVVVSVTNRSLGVSYEFALDSPNFVPLAGDITVTGEGVHFVTVREVGGGNSATFTVLIDDTPPTVLVSSPFNGQFIVTSDDAPIAAYDCLDSGSGPATCSGTIAVDQPVSMMPGTQTFSVGSSDFAGNLASGVTNTYYVVEPVTVDSPLDPVAIEDSVTISVGATDLSEFVETVTVDWGDGTTPEVVSGVNIDNFTAEHVYAGPDIYRVTVTVDYEGAFSQQVVSDFVVVYDPTGGFVTGGGWIDSPPGAYTPNDDTDPDVTGRASFGFVAKYKRGQSVPDGNTNFRFKAGDLSFRSVDYEYLIISGARARFKGRGQVNGGSDLYRFRITALDSDVNGNDAHVVDSFRIQIWDDNTGVLYDNGRGADNATGDGGTTALGGGSISIKNK